MYLASLQIFLRQMTSFRLAKGERAYPLDRLKTHGMIFDYNWLNPIIFFSFFIGWRQDWYIEDE